MFIGLHIQNIMLTQQIFCDPASAGEEKPSSFYFLCKPVGGW